MSRPIYAHHVPVKMVPVVIPLPVKIETTFELNRVDTSSTIDSDVSMQEQLKITLTLSKHDIELLRMTWNKMLVDTFDGVSDPDTGGKASLQNSSTVASSLFCRQFYSNLLAMKPGLEKMFPSIRHQAVSFAGVMSFAISQLENLTALDDYLSNLGKRHARILSIEAPHYELMGQALIKTFNERFGELFTIELESLWIKLYLYLSNSLLQFGIDPILKIERNNNLFENNFEVYSNNSISLTQSMDSLALSSNDSQLSLSHDQTRSSVSTMGSAFSNRFKFHSNTPNSPNYAPSIASSNSMKIKKLPNLPEKSNGKKKDNCVIV